jgi:hypothetical protein
MFMFCGYMTFFTYDKAFSLAFINAIHRISTEKTELEFRIREFIIKQLYCVWASVIIIVWGQSNPTQDPL